MNHANGFYTNLTLDTSAGVTTTPLDSIPSIDAPFTLAFDCANANGHYEIVNVTSKTATNVNHAATSYAHTTDEEVRMVVGADELDGFASTKTNFDTNMGDGSSVIGMARQAIMNGNFDVWQRGTSVALADVTNTFLSDRWGEYIDKNSGTLPTLTRTRQITTAGDIPNAYFFARLETNGAGTSLGTSSYHQMYQKIENGVRNLCGNGKEVTVSFYARSSISNKRLGISLQQNYGTGGTPTAQENIITQAPITLTSSWTKYTVTFTTNTLVGKTFGTNNDDRLTLNFWYMWGTTSGNSFVYPSVTAETYVGSGTIDIAQVQLCAGDVALPFQPKSFDEELRACQRYYEKSFDYEVSPADGAGFNGAITSIAASTHPYHLVGSIQYKVTKRTVPTLTLYNPNASSSDKIYSSIDGNKPATTVSSGMSSVSVHVNNSACSLNSTLRVHWTADAEL